MSGINGGLPVNLGRNRHGRVRVVTVPRGSRVAYQAVRAGQRLCFVLLPNSAGVVAMTADGRVWLPDALQQLVASRVFGVDPISTTKLPVPDQPQVKRLLTSPPVPGRMA